MTSPRSPLSLLLGLPALALACTTPSSATDGASSTSSTASTDASTSSPTTSLPDPTEDSPTVTESTTGCDDFVHELEVTPLTADEAVEFVSVTALNSTLALALAADGRLFRPDDGGVFRALAMPADPALKRVELVDAATWMVVGDGGVAHRSVDFGVTWSPVDLGTDAALRDIAFFNFVEGGGTSLYGIAVGDGVIVRSTDGGATWQPAALAPAATGSFHAVTGNPLVAVGAGGLAVHSVDGGVTWNPVATGTTDDLVRIAQVYDEAAIVTATGKVLQQAPGEVQFYPVEPAAPVVGIGRFDGILAALYDDGTLGGWPESSMLAAPTPVGAGARVTSRGNASGILVAGDDGLLAFVTLAPSGACKLPRGS
ncbi:Photosynthesis system II assembly factor YCF48 [Nannocystis exedens]|uniref:Photosynthesis system II assembly factor YCF48 n=1 Tax=Nannocystis exedens TaxID=54 RepID=A0A1I2EGH4_9BACT|nr:YCF48-related protein [Nannocystis exedens]PCC74725.1 Ycf48-like protein [Nannocystis exedens]SFE91965.1 Photosynthesis system II assembly factor YCF48 [Nannocystis exedens]